MKEYKKTFWSARDEDGALFLYTERPELETETGTFSGTEGLEIDESLLDWLTFEGSPCRIQVSIEAYDEELTQKERLNIGRRQPSLFENLDDVQEKIYSCARRR